MVRFCNDPIAPLFRFVLMALLILPVISMSSKARAADPSPGHRSATSAAGSAAVVPCSMTEARMNAMSAAWYSTHPKNGAVSLAAASATFNVGSFYFNADNNLSTQVDTVRINAGQSVTWTWVSGSHTVTSGTGSGDPDAGLLFDQPINSTSTSFNFAFPDPGLYPFFCRFHELSMRGFVSVQGVGGVSPIGGDTARPGFVSSPSPNPTAAGATFRFALAVPGRTLVEVFDVAGERIAVVLDRQLEKGVYQASWDGRLSSGSRVRAGAYFVRLLAPALNQTRRLVIVR